MPTPPMVLSSTATPRRSHALAESAAFGSPGLAAVGEEVTAMTNPAITGFARSIVPFRRPVPLAAGFGRLYGGAKRFAPGNAHMNALHVPQPAWMTEDLVLLEEQSRRFIADEFVPHIDRWHAAGIYEREVWNKAGGAGRVGAG